MSLGGHKLRNVVTPQAAPLTSLTSHWPEGGHTSTHKPIPSKGVGHHEDSCQHPGRVGSGQQTVARLLHKEARVWQAASAPGA